VVIGYRWAQNQYSRLPTLAAEQAEGQCGSSDPTSSARPAGSVDSAYAISANYVAKHLPLALLAPAIVDAILDDQRQESRKARLSCLRCVQAQ
jgi:hypothetical protein